MPAQKRNRKSKVNRSIPRTIPAPADPKFVRAACMDNPNGTGGAEQQPLAGKPYLIQRATMRRNVALDTIVGFDTAFSLSYMGSSEFEWGALPKSLKTIAEAFPAFVVVDTGYRSVDDEPLFVVVHEKQRRAVLEALPTFLDGTSYTKERVCLKERLAREEYNDYDLWWDIDNHWFAVLGTTQVLALQQAIHKLRIKWGHSDDRPSAIETQNGV